MQVNNSFSYNARKITNTLKQRPVESFLLVMLTFFNTFLSQAYDGLLVQSAWIVVPIMFPIAFIANALIPQDTAWRRTYDLLIPATIIAFIAGIDDKFTGITSSTQYLTILGLLTTFALIIKNFKNDSQFITNIVSLGWAALRSLAVSIGILIALAIIIFSFETVFKLNIAFNLLSIPWTLVFPLMLLAFYDSTPAVKSIDSELGNGIVNFVVTIAIIAFTIIMYVDIIKIIVTWSLPTGGLALTCYVYFIAAISCSSLYRIAMVNIFNRFYHWLPALAIPIIILFWVAAFRRIYDYGFTENRVYMLFAGLLNIVFMFMIFFDRQRTYKSTIIHAMVIFFILGLIPPLSAKNIADHFQWTNVEGASDNVVAEPESPSGYYIFQNSYTNVDPSGFKDVLFTDVNCHGDTIDIYRRNSSLYMTLSLENTVRAIAHQNDMTYDEMLSLAHCDVAQTPLNYQNDSLLIVFNRIMFNSFTQDVQIDAILVK